MCSPAQQAQPYYHQQPTMHCQPYKRRSSATTSRSSSPTSTIHDGGMPQNMMATFNTKVSSSTPKRYKCAVCFKKFTRPSSLTTHMYSHTGEVNNNTNSNNNSNNNKTRCCKKLFIWSLIYFYFYYLLFLNRNHLNVLWMDADVISL